MKALSLTQPWASLVALGEKQMETRDWRTDYRGPLAIHATKTIPDWVHEWYEGTPAVQTILARHGITDLRRLPLGAIVGTCQVTACIPSERLEFGRLLKGHERVLGNYGPGRYAITLVDCMPVDPPIPARGSLGLWEWEPPGDFTFAFTPNLFGEEGE